VRCHGFYPPFLFENGEIVTIAGNTRKDCGKNTENMHMSPETSHAQRWNLEGKKQYSQDIFLEKILSFIRANQDKPFFLFHPTQLPHGPISIPKVHPEVADNPNLTELEKEYASMVKMLDDHVGIIISELKKLGLEENTMIVFASDNGHEIYYAQAGRCEKPYRNLKTGKLFDNYESKYYSDLSGDVFNGNADMAGLKRSNLEGGVHIPLVFYWKGHLEKGKARTEVVTNYDFLPTMADLLKVPLPVSKDGISFLPVLLENRKLPADRHVVFGSNLGPGLVMNDGWKIRHYRKEKVFELYNLPQDPQERNNLIQKNPERAEKMKTILLQECGGNLENGVNRAG
jgi:arylsulfatase A-like enzyme